ncbi:MAG TPA: hypothetical protein VMY42_07800 [Thermoguttaceae bacterium]|nr:hypothetical protein [Thermoguttaceae bacterium]
MGTRLSRLVVLGLGVSGVVLIVCLSRGLLLARADEAEQDSPEVTDPLGANAACYVCHIPFVREELGRVHLEAKVSCIKCHGLSAPHANDEDIGATPPDVVFERGGIDAMCCECHEEHDVPADQVVARFLDRRLPRRPPAICTDCHGTHKIEPPAEEG